MNSPKNRLARLKTRIHYTLPFYILVIFTTLLIIVNREKVLLGIISCPEGRSNSAWLYTLGNKGVQQQLHAIFTVPPGEGAHHCLSPATESTFSLLRQRDGREQLTQTVRAVTAAHRDLTLERRYPRSIPCAVLHTHDQGEKMSVCWDTGFASLATTSSDDLATGITSNTKCKLVQAERCL